jgi:hypothetical protein
MKERHGDIASALPADLDSLPRLRGFRLRGMKMTRLETFIDAAFAFAISMLVIAANQVLDTPRLRRGKQLIVIGYSGWPIEVRDRGSEGRGQLSEVKGRI